MRVLIIVATILTSTAASAGFADQRPQVGGPSIGSVFGCGDANAPCPPRAVARRMHSAATPIMDAFGSSFDPTDAARQCSRQAGEHDYTVSVKNSSGGFSLECKIDRGSVAPTTVR